MRILRVKLTNYRGVTERELCFEPVGITIVSGPNEIGKSSVAEAIDLVFDELDSTTKQSVKNIQPVDRDAGAEVEIEIETGDYAFTLRKRFQRRPLTELKVTRPAVENWTGREAHERVTAILTETIDPALWRALRVQQGEALEQASWLDSTSLAHALDRAAGATQRGPREESLFEAAAAEQARYFTKTGREKGEIAAAAKEVQTAASEVRELEQALELLERDIARSSELRAQQTQLQSAAMQAETELKTREQAFELVSGLRDQLLATEARRDAALAKEREALQASQQRSQLIKAHTDSVASAARAQTQFEEVAPALLAGAKECDQADQAAKATKDQLSELEALEAAQRGDVDQQRAETELASLRERYDRITSLRGSLEHAAAELAKLPIREEAVTRIREGELEFEKAKARLESEGPLVRITPQVDLQVTSDGKPTPLAKGEVNELQVAESLELTLPGVVHVAIEAGAAAATRVKALDEARGRYATLCKEYAVANHARAVEALGDRNRILVIQRDGQEELAELLGGGDENALKAKITDETKRVADLASKRDPARVRISDAAKLESDLRTTHDAREKLQNLVASSWQRREELVTRRSALEKQSHEAEFRLQTDVQRRDTLAAELTTARTSAPDETLKQQTDSQSARAREAESAWSEAKKRLDEAGIAEAEAQLEKARTDRETRARNLRAAEDEALEVSTRLEAQGQQGLFERLEKVRAQLYRLTAEDESLRRRAGAARRLHETLLEERDSIREGYSAPLRERIKLLGQDLFGQSFAVELDNELRIERRILDGISLPFDQLSGGAREQLALITRLACASLVAEGGGAPVILDDALGHSDARRLVKLGEVLNHAADQCQILILTCAPERYASVSGARLLTLG